MKPLRTNRERYAARHQQICERAEREFTENHAPVSMDQAVDAYVRLVEQHARQGNEMAGILATAAAHLVLTHARDKNLRLSGA